ncbi:hypothetical protein SUGI_0605150 [Cryptomeria japonica]|nr:hypothetical protein SUGI_0605150 [Cryptomeria japonica]
MPIITGRDVNAQAQSEQLNALGLFKLILNLTNFNSEERNKISMLVGTSNVGGRLPPDG